MTYFTGKAYEQEVKRIFIDEFGFKSTESLPDGVYGMRINGVTDLVKVTDGAISFGNIKLGRHSKRIDR